MSAGDTMQGRRYDDVADPAVAHERMEPGGYRRSGGEWEACTPDGLGGNLSQHEVVEHDDGTITVSPSILVSAGNDRSWHGYLERGVWREV